MTTHRHRFGVAGFLLLLVACADSPSNAPQVSVLAPGSGDLALTLRSVPRIATATTRDVRRLDSTSVNELLRSRGIDPSTSALVDGSTSIITRTEAVAGFTTKNEAPVAYAQALMNYFGNAARQDVLLELRRGGSPIPVPIISEEETHLLPGFYGFTVSSWIPVGETCGHWVRATTTHRAWNVSPLPGTSSSPFLSNSVGLQSDPKDQPPCPPERREEKEVTSGGGGSSGKDTDEAQWYVCTWEVWYDRSTGAELSRKLLYCYPL